MADSKEAGSIPTWDGAARGWRRYTREVAWFVQATPTHKRRYCASRLMSRLTGPARLLAMSWSRVAFDGEDGTRRLLQQLAASPLVRRSLPNAAAICQQYFSFKRAPNETMGNFLVRETLVQEEFTEALIRLHEEKLGITQADRDFGLPKVESWKDDDWRHADWWWYGEEEDDDDQPEGDPREADQPDEERATQEERPEGAPHDDARPPERGATGSSPSHRDGQATIDAGDGGSQGRHSTSPPLRAIDELSVADSFIMSVLRGWRLLQAAGLTPEEVRDILSSTRNSLDYETVAQALQGLWDEQLLGQRYRPQGHHAFATIAESADAFYHDYNDEWWDGEDEWWDEQAYYAGWECEDHSWSPWLESDEHAYQVAAPETTPQDDEKYREAQQAEQIAEQLAAESHRSWTEAQKATQALRRDRGFGAHTTTTAGVRCFICNGSHFARDCPDRGHPAWKGHGKGAGKKGYYQHLDDYYIGKGKSKHPPKGKGKKGYWLEGNAIFRKGKNKGKTKDSGSRSVNAYSNELFLGGLEVSEAMESSPSPPSNTEPHRGMLDSGATASAAPEAVVKGLVKAVLQCDRSARIELEQYARPFFRFGNGKWSRALGRTTISSSVSGSSRSFSLYTLPNPPEYYSSHFDSASLVPVLIGMDFIGPQGVGMIVDFGTGLAMNSKDESPQIYNLETNKKGHYVLDIVQYLTQGATNREGQALVVVHKNPPNDTPLLEHHVLELGTAWFDMTATDHVTDEQLALSRTRIWELYQRSMSLRHGTASTASSAQMCGPTVAPLFSSTSPSRTQLDGGDDPSALHARRHDPPEGEGQEQSEAPGSRSLGISGPSRPSISQGDMALLRPTSTRSSSVQRSRSVDTLRSVRFEASVRAESGITCSNHRKQEPGHGAENVGGASTPHEGPQADGDNLSSHATPDRRRGGSEDGDHGAHGDGYQDLGSADTVHSDHDDTDTRTGLQWRNESGARDTQQLDGDDRCPGRRPGHGIRAGEPRLNGMVKPVTNATAKRVMAFATMMAAATTSLLTGLHLHERDGLWEVACAPHSWLSQSAEQHSLKPRRINLNTGYDLYKPETWIRLQQLRRVRRPRKIWLSLPCTKWCPWTSVNFNTPEKQDRLESDRRRERRMLWNMNQFVKNTFEEDPETELYYEWPHPCYGWKQQPLVDLEEHFEKIGVPWLACRVDGCNYGLRNQDDDTFIRKKWLIRTTDERFHKTFRAKVCPGNHQHCTIQGAETARSAYYPWRMVQAFTRFWRDQMVPTRHCHLLHRADDLPALQEMFDASDDEPDVAETFEECPEDDEIVQENNTGHDMMEMERLTVENMARQARLQANFTFDALENILMYAMMNVKDQAGNVKRWSSQVCSRLILGAYSHGAFSGITKSTFDNKELTKYINEFFHHHCPEHRYSSLMVCLNSKTLPHQDHHNLKQSSSVLLCVGDFQGGGLWISAKPDGEEVLKRRRLPDGTLRLGCVKETKRQFVTFSPHVLHATESWRGNRISISAYTTRLAPWVNDVDRHELQTHGFRIGHGMQALAVSEINGVEEVLNEDAGQVQLPDGVTKTEYQSWEAKIAKFHKAAGHPTNRNLARIVQEANHPSWKVQVALRHSCPACKSIRPGGMSAGQVPPASTHHQYQAWEAVAVDSGEWVPPGKRIKWKFLMFMDVATKLRVVQPLFEYNFLEMRAETGKDLMKSFAERWLGCYPKPKVVIMDSAKSFVSEAVGEFFSDINVMTHYVAEKEPWANGTIEAALQDVKRTASAISLDDPLLPPDTVLQLSVAALNATEYTAGFSAHQWAFGKAHRATDEDMRSFASSDPTTDFAKMVTARQRAEEVARQTRARRTLSKLGNTTVRQPVRDFAPMTLVKVWRKVWPKEQHSGARGGFKKSGRPHWIGPGRVIFNEMLPHQSNDSDRKHVVWVLIGHQLLRCSVHSVRPVDEVERFKYETSGEEDSSRWRTLADILPRREYHDLTDQVPDHDETELPGLPQEPDQSTIVAPPRRVRGKQGPPPLTMETTGASSSTTTTDVPGQTSRPTLHEGPEHPTPEVNVYDQPETKKARVEEASWVDELYVEAKHEEEEMDLSTAMEEVNDFLRIEFDVESPTSNRQRKMLERNPIAYMVKKMRDSEVNISRLAPHERQLFARAKLKEVDSFIKNEAVRKCMDSQEIKEAYDSGRIVRARWVLTWKPIPPEDREEAAKDALENKETLHDKRGLRKAKARIVLLGFQHPNLLDPSFKTSSPVQSTLGRNLLYVMAAHHQWDLEGLDLATAFLQTMPTEADEGLFTTGVEELRQALGVTEEGVMKILKNIYGSTTAPRGLWLDLHKKLTALGAVPVMGERCLWIWLSKTERDGDLPQVIGAMGGHVDDFHRIGDQNSAEWLDIKAKIDAAYKWGMAKVGNYRHAGTDVSTQVDSKGHKKIVVDQEYYIEGLQDIDIDPDRLRQDGPLQPRELAACRTALGALQWLAVQSQPQLCSRCNLLLTEAVAAGTLQTAREIQQMIAEVRHESYKLEFFKFPTARHWTELTFISMGDQAHGNRSKGDSTGGLLTLVAGPEAAQGKVCPMCLVSWRTWKLQRKALGSNDAEVQSIYEAEDQNFRVRLLWTEMHGAGTSMATRSNLVQDKESQVLRVRGILCTDSKGGYDALERNESPLLGLSNMRAALQAFALRDNLKRVNCELRWLASDYDLADAMTKKRAESRVGLMKFLKTWLWSIAFDPNFVSAKRNKKHGRTAASRVDQYLRTQGAT